MLGRMGRSRMWISSRGSLWSRAGDGVRMGKDSACAVFLDERWDGADGWFVEGRCMWARTDGGGRGVEKGIV